MSKEMIWGKDNRAMLHDVLPLNTPFSLIVGASSACNFKCRYCIHSLPNNKLKSINFNLEIMKYNIFTKLIDDARSFPKKIKSLQFLKDGEPLLNRRLPDMINYSKKSDIFERIELITNGSLLTPNINLKLIDAGLDTIRISLQGVNREKYYEIANIDIDFDKFVSNIRHFYENRKYCRIHLKMIDIGIKKDLDTFHYIFDNICDEFSIQCTIPYFNDVDYSNIDIDYDVNLYGDKNGNYIRKSVNICSRPFMSIYVSADGDVMPCCREDDENLILGNIKNESIFDIWNGDKLKNFRLLQLKKKRFEHIVCKDCCLPDKITVHNDNLDNYTEKLLKCFG